jgi:putative NADH-flavin reductase
MHVALIGATGRIGSRILNEAVSRGHTVTAISRHPGNVPANPKVTSVAGDLDDPDAIAKAIKGRDAVICSYGPGAEKSSQPEAYDLYVKAGKGLIAAVKAAGIRRVLVVGGAASLKTPAGVELLDSPDWPAVFQKYAPKGLREIMYMLKKEPDLDWVFLSPSTFIAPGERTGKFRIGKDHLLFGPDGQSRISMEDYAVAMVDELESPKHHSERFTVGY